jgi:hypothetical protein
LKNHVIEDKDEGRWQTPVWVRVGDGMAEPVWGARQALDYLAYRWPAGRGRHYLGAKANCLAATRKQLAPEYARDAFLRASVEASMLG